ncbi:pyridoxal-dependent decarboxylase [Lepidopterella palustris CBS 459.81]|uniref:Pyridoxal-dependent decarboxylase n=1 Tax=Lepidopterella palustris CBS 459.81 TaxID=1314670 RepID=A0A8E2E2R7_9PEZI|nr:pyridoxal-dependent decarboxylase [Lepidopterella palustris CBS 459.81]
MFDDQDAIAKLSTAIAQLHTGPIPDTVLPSQKYLTQARESLIQHLPDAGLGVQKVIQHLREDIAPGFNASSRSPNYYGFVTGGSTPAASLADNLTTAYDQNVQIHLPKETIATELEDRALSLLCELLMLDPAQWQHRTFTTGATASNVVGLACGREYVISIRNTSSVSVGEVGIYEALHRAGLDKIQLLTTVPHSSLGKAAALIGLGRASVKTVGLREQPYKFDMELLEKLLQQPGVASIVAISAAEVNTGLFATSGLAEMQKIRKLCDIYGAWIHVDGAFGILGRVLAGKTYEIITQGCEGMELADSITGDGHKLLNVPYDCGFFVSRHRDIAQSVFWNPNAAYLNATAGSDAIPSPLNIGIENSRRLRALPVYATLTAYGRTGYREMLERQIVLARMIADFILDSPSYELLPQSSGSKEESLASIYIIVLFRAKDEEVNAELVQRINATGKVYVSGTSWDGRPACRFAVSNWQVDATRDFPVVRHCLEYVAISKKE